MSNREGTKATLKSTGEPAVILYSPPGGHGSGPSTRHLCLLPPQAPGHRRRMQWIRSTKMNFASPTRSDN